MEQQLDQDMDDVMRHLTRTPFEELEAVLAEATAQIVKACGGVYPPFDAWSEAHKQALQDHGWTVDEWEAESCKVVEICMID
jgi:hypothetical protein